MFEKAYPQKNTRALQTSPMTEEVFALLQEEHELPLRCPKDTRKYPKSPRTERGEP